MSHEAFLLKIQSLSQRERQLLMLSLLVISYMLFSALVFTPLDVTQRELEQKVEKLGTDTLVQAGLKKVYEEGIGSDPDRVKKRQLDSMRQRLKNLDSELAELTVGLVPAAQLPQLLQDVLSRNGALVLSEVETLPIAEMSLVDNSLEQTLDADKSLTKESEEHNGNTTNSVGEAASSESAGVFQHSVRVSLQGAFFPLIEYLQTLEDLPWQLFWQQLSYRVDDYPTAQVEFVVYTLSTEEGLFSAQ